MRRALVVAVVALTAGLSAATAETADAPTRTVAMPGKLYEPARLDVLVGTMVTWRNDDSTNHTVTADDDAFASGYVPPGGSFSFAFARQGRYAFHCTIHKFMRGEVNVYGLVLVGPEDAVTAGARVVLAGLAPPGTPEVHLRGGADSTVVRPRPDGSFAVRVVVAAPGRYRAVAGALSSPVVRVVARPRVRASREGRALVVRTVPGRAGAIALLQSYDRERFDWVTVAHGKLDARSRLRLTLPRDAERVRVLVRGSAGWGDAASATIRWHGGRAGSATTGTHAGSHSG